MNRSELVRLVARQTRVELNVVEEVVDNLLELVALTLAVDEEIALRGFGKFRPAKRGPTVLKNPKSGEPIEVGPRRTATFVPSTLLKERLNSNSPL